MAEENKSLEINADNSVKVEAKQDTVSVEDYKTAEYQGKTLTIEQEKAKAEDLKKTAGMENADGEKKRKKREASKDKFKDEDVVKYMYEDWFLGALSWLCNKIEDKTLDLIDAAGQKWVDRHNRRVEQKKAFKDARLDAVHKKVKDFDEIVKKNMTERLDRFCDAVPTEDGGTRTPTPAEKESMKTVAKLVLMMSAADMKDDLMHNDKSWRQNKDPKQEYLDDKHLHAELLRRANTNFKTVNQALRSFDDAERNAFLKDMAKRVNSINDRQDKQIEKDRFDAIGKSPDKKVRKELNALKALIDKNARRQAPQSLRDATAPTPYETNLQSRQHNVTIAEQSLAARSNAYESRKAVLNKWKDNRFNNVKVDFAALAAQRGTGRS